MAGALPSRARPPSLQGDDRYFQWSFFVPTGSNARRNCTSQDSLATSITGVVSAGVKIATGLYTIVDTAKSAPKELAYMAQQIEHLSDLFGCTFHLIEENETLYQERLTMMLRDVRWQFKIIQQVVENCLCGGQTRKRFRFLFKTKLVGDLLRKLEALKSTMMLTL